MKTMKFILACVLLLSPLLCQAQKKGLCAPRDRSFHGDKESLARLKAVPTPYPLKTRPCSPLRLR